MAWGVEGFGVSFIAPHSLAARSLVVAPDDGLRILSRSEHGVDLSVDGRPAGALEPGTELRARFVSDAAVLAQQPGHVLLPQAAGEVRPALSLAVTSVLQSRR